MKGRNRRPFYLGADSRFHYSLFLVASRNSATKKELKQAVQSGLVTIRLQKKRVGQMNRLTKKSPRLKA